ncbi:MAG: putative sugar O-methyltransferase [Nevskiales bacterium]
MKRQLLRSLRRLARALGHELVPQQTGAESYRAASHSTETALPPDAQTWLRADHPQLQVLRERYQRLTSPATVPSHWNTEFLRGNLDLCYFRGDNAYVWQYRAAGSDLELRYYLSLLYLKKLDQRGLLSALGEDGLFGCWKFTFPDHPAISRDLLDSVNELYFLDRHMQIFSRAGLRVLDIGAGYGRLAHRMVTALPQLERYTCVDAVPESTFLCDYYLRFRQCEAKARSIPLDEIEQALTPGGVDPAVNIHSFSECTLAAIEWWLAWLKRLRVPVLMIVPNNGDKLLSTERNRKHLDFLPALEAAGYRLKLREPKYLDETMQRLAQKNPDYYFLFELAG